MRNSLAGARIRGYLPRYPGPSRNISQQRIIGGTVTAAIILAAIFIAQPGARAPDKIMVITWVILLVSIAMFHYISKFTSKLIMRHYDIYTVMAEIEERDKAVPAHVFATPTRASAHFLQLFYENREKFKLTTRYDIDPVALQKIGEDEGFVMGRLEAERLAKSLVKKYPNLVMDIRMRAERIQNMSLIRKRKNFS